MVFIQSVFNNREIAIITWVIIVIILVLFMKSTRDFIKSIIPILFCRKFIIFYIVFISFLVLILYGLYIAGIWDYSLLKDTVFWVLFVELPIFTKTIEKADGGHFFSKIIKDNIAISVLIEFFIGFWTFSLFIELLIVPLSILISFVYAISERDKEHQSVKRFINSLLMIWGFVLVVNAFYCFFHDSISFLNIETFKSFLLPMLLLILNLPVVYGLALYNMYEQVFVKIKGLKKEQRKMKLRIVLFAGINLSKIAAIKKNISKTVLFCTTDADLKLNLEKLSRYLELQIGANYMKRSRYYIIVSIIGFLVGVIGLAITNYGFSLDDLFSSGFFFKIPPINDILIYFFSTLSILSITFLVYSIGFNKKQREDITQVKKFALFELLYLVKQQKTMLTEYPPIDDSVLLFNTYVVNSNEIKLACDKVLGSYVNLLTVCEREVIEQLRFSAMQLSTDIGFISDNTNNVTVDEFCKYYKEKVHTAPQDEDFNTYTNMVKTDIEKYSKQIDIFENDFILYYK